MMKLMSLNVGLPREVIWKDKQVTTGIFKEPVEGPVMLRKLNLDGDRQADLSVHGGECKAVYVYPAEHYDFWRSELPGMDLPWGIFGENFTTQGMNEDETNIGDQFRVGSAEVVVTQPRLPCYKLAARFGRDDMIKRFLNSGRTGFYFAVLREGTVSPGDSIERSLRDPNNVSVSDITRLYVRDRHDTDTLSRAIEVEALPENWRSYFRERIKRAGGNG